MKCFLLLGLIWVLILMTGVWFLFLGIFRLDPARTLSRNTVEIRLFSKPPVPSYQHIYIFNLTNAEQFLRGQKPVVQELGPYVFRVTTKRRIEWIRETIGFRELKTRQFEASLSTRTLADRIVTFNYDKLATQHNSDATSLENSFISITVGELLYKGSQRLFPFDNWIGNFGPLYVVTNRRAGGINSILSINGSSNLPYYGRNCSRLEGTNGELFTSFVIPPEIQKVFIPNLCKAWPLKFRAVFVVRNEQIARFGGDARLFSKTEVPTLDRCLGSMAAHQLGTFDATRCYLHNEKFMAGELNTSMHHPGGPAIAISWPHFLHGDRQLRSAIVGVWPDREKHDFYVDIHSESGLAVDMRIRYQMNVKLPLNLDNQLSSDVVLPIFWQETLRTPSDRDKFVSKIRRYRLSAGWAASVASFCFFVFVMLAEHAWRIVYDLDIWSSPSFSSAYWQTKRQLKPSRAATLPPQGTSSPQQARSISDWNAMHRKAGQRTVALRGGGAQSDSETKVDDKAKSAAKKMQNDLRKAKKSVKSASLPKPGKKTSPDSARAKSAKHRGFKGSVKSRQTKSGELQKTSSSLPKKEGKKQGSSDSSKQQQNRNKKKTPEANVTQFKKSNKGVKPQKSAEQKKPKAKDDVKSGGPGKKSKDSVRSPREKSPTKDTVKTKLLSTLPPEARGPKMGLASRKGTSAEMKQTPKAGKKGTGKDTDSDPEVKVPDTFQPLSILRVPVPGASRMLISSDTPSQRSGAADASPFAMGYVDSEMEPQSSVCDPQAALLLNSTLGDPVQGPCTMYNENNNGYYDTAMAQGSSQLGAYAAEPWDTSQAYNDYMTPPTPMQYDNGAVVQDGAYYDAAAAAHDVYSDPNSSGYTGTYGYDQSSAPSWQ